MAGMVGSSGEKVFSAAISQAPVSDWHYYGKSPSHDPSRDCHMTYHMVDSIYTERYMLTPEGNPTGYQVSQGQRSNMDCSGCVV